MLNDILNEPNLYFEINESAEKINEMNIFPITIENYDKFQECNRLLYLTKNHFGNAEDYALLDLIIYGIGSENKEDIEKDRKNRIKNLEELFSLVTKEKFFFYEENNYYFFITNDEKNIIHRENYEEIRKTIMRQNLMFEQKIFKNKITQEWAEMTLQAKIKNQPKIGIEEMITTVSTKAHKHYWDLRKYSIYQLYSDFYRIRKDKNYDISSMARCQGADVTIEDFAEQLDLYKNPYDDLFVEDSKLDKLQSICK